MSNKIIDERVVKMEFDNGKFEQNAQASLRTIDKLEKALKFENANKGFSKIEDAANKINLNKLDKNIQTIANRFSTMGIIGDQVVRNLTTSVMNGIGKMQRLLAAPIAQMINGGKARAMNIANAEFSLKGLGIDWKAESEAFEVAAKHLTDEEQRVLKETGKFADSLYKDIDYAVSGTAYGLDEAAKAASILATSNVAIGDEMRTALRAISGVSAMTNRSYTEISNIFTHVAGKNKLQTEELNMLAERGLGAASKLGEYLGKSETEIKEMVSKGQIDFKTFAAAMDDAFGEHAKDANNTFNGALSNMKAALSRIGADIAGPLFDACIKPFNDIRKIIDNLRVALQPLFKDVTFAIDLLSQYASALLGLTGLVTDHKLGLDQMPRLTLVIRNLESAFVFLFYAVSQVVKPIREAFFEVFKPTGDIIVNITSALMMFALRLMMISDSAANIKPIFKSIFTILKSGFSIIGNIGSIIGKILSALSPLAPLILEVVSAISEVISTGIDWINNSGLLDTALNKLSDGIQIVIEYLRYFVEVLVDLISQFISWVRGINNINPPIFDLSKGLESISAFATKAANAITSFFTSLFGNKKIISNTNEDIEEMSGVLGERLGPALKQQTKDVEAAGESIKKYGNIFDVIKASLSKGLDSIGKQMNMSKVFNSKNIKEWAANYVKSYKRNFEIISNIGKSFTSGSSFEGLKTFFGIGDGTVDWNRIFKIGQFTLAIGGVYKLIKLLELFERGIKVVTNIVQSITGSINRLTLAVREYVRGENDLKRAIGFKRIAEGIFILVAAIAGLASLTLINGISFADLWHAAGLIAAITIVVAGILLAYQKLQSVIKSADAIEKDEDPKTKVIDKVLGTLKDICDSFAQSLMFTGIAFTVAIISASLLIVAEAFRQWYVIISDTTKTSEDIMYTIAALVSIFAAVVGSVGWLLMLVEDAEQSSVGIALTFVGLVAAVWAMLYAIRTFHDIKWDEYKETIILIGAFFVALSVAVGLISHFSNGNSGLESLSAGGGIVAGLLGFAEAIKKLQDVGFLQILKAFYPMIMVLIAIVGAIVVLSKCVDPLTIANIAGIVLTINSLAGAISSTVTAISLLTHMDAAKQLQGFIEIIALLATIGGVMALIGHFGVHAAPLFAMSVLIVTLCGALAWVAMMDWKDVLKGIGFLSLALLAAGKALTISSLVFFKPDKIWAIIGLIVAVGVALALLAKEKWYKIILAVGELALTLFIISKALKKISNSLITLNWAALLSFAGSVLILAGSIALLAQFDWKRVLLATLDICAVMLALAFAIKLMNGFTITTPGAIMAGGFGLLIGGLIAEIGYIIYKLSSLPNTEGVDAAAKALTMVVGSLTGLMAAVIIFMKTISPKSLAELVPTAALIGGCVLVILALSGIVHVLSSVPNPDGAIKAAEALILLCGALAGLMVAVAVVGAIIIAVGGAIAAAVGAGLLVLAALIVLAAVIVGIITGFGMIINYLDEMAKAQGEQKTISERILDGVETGFNILIKVFEKVGEGIGKLHGVAVKTFTEEVIIGIENAMATITQLVNEFDALRDIFKNWQDEDVEVDKFVQAFKDTVAAIQGLVVITAEMDALSGDLFKNLAPSYPIVDSPTSSGILGGFLNIFKDKITDEDKNNFDKLIENAKGCVEVLKEFNDQLKGYEFDMKALRGAQQAAKLVQEFCGAMRDYVGLESQNLGYDNTQMGSTLKSTLETFADAIKAFNEKFKGYKFNTSLLDSAIDYLTRLKDLVKEVPTIFTTSKGANTVGNKVSGFGGFINDIATALINFSDSMNNVDTSNVESGIGLLEKFAGVLNDVSQKIPGVFDGVTGGANNKVVGRTNFVLMITSTGEALSTFSEYVNDISTVHVKAVIAVLDDLYTFMDKISNHGSFDSDFGEAFSKIGKYTTEDGNIFSGFDVDKIGDDLVNSFRKIINDLVNADYTTYYNRIKKIGKNFLLYVRDGVKDETAASFVKIGFYNALNHVLTLLVTEGNLETKFNKFGENIIKYIADGIKLQTSIDNVSQAVFYSIGNGCTDALNKLITGLNACGQRIASYIAMGINSPSSISTIASAIQSAVDAAASGVSVTIGINVDAQAAASGFESAVDQGVIPIYNEKGEQISSAIKQSYGKAGDADTKGSAGFQTVVRTNGKRNSAVILTAYGDMAKSEKKGGKQVEDTMIGNNKAMYENDSRFKAATEKHVWTMDATKTRLKQAWQDFASGNKSAIEIGGELLKEGFDGLQSLTSEGMSNLLGISLDKAKEFQEAITGKATEVGNAVGDAAAGAGKAAGGGAKAGGDAFVASYSEFWQNVYAVHTLGMQGFEQKLETFEKWQENTLKKTQDIVDKYKNAMEDAKKEAASGLFEEVAERNEEVTKEKLKKNLEDQVNQIKEFNNIILQLRTRLMGTNLFDAITEMGVDSIDELRALNDMTDTELSEYANLYDQKYLASFQGIQQKAQSELSNLYGGMAVNIDQFAATFDGSLKSIEGYFSAQAEAIQAAGAPVGSFITQGVATGMTDPAAKEALATGADAAIHGEGGIVDALKVAGSINSPSEDPDIQGIGSFAIQGVAEGMTNEDAVQSLADAAAKVMDIIIVKLNTAFDEQGMPDKLKIFGENLTNTITSAVQTSSLEGGVDGGGSAIYMAGASVLTDFLNGLNSKREEITTKISTLMSTISNEIKGEPNKLKFKTAGTELFKAMMKGFEMGWFGGNGEGKGEGEEGYGAKVIKKIMTKIIKNLKEYKGGEKGGKSLSFYKTGQEFIKGLINGLKSKEGELYKAVEEIVKKAIQAANNAAKVASPSKLTTETGMYMGMGLVNGINSMSGAVSLAAASITEEALNGFRSISEVLGGLEDFDATPVIAPIMDLTGIQNGISTMGNMLNNANSYEVAASINSGLEAQRVAKLNEMTNLRRAMDSITSSNSLRSNEMLQLQSAVNSLNSTINGQTTPDYTQLQASINNLNNAMAGITTGNTVNVSPTFNIQSNDPEAVAEEVNKALQDMVNRRSAVWA